jgi:hypothetical protein
VANAQRHDPPQRLLLTLEPIGHTADPRKTWQYNRELRRILRPPNVAHDFRAFDVDNLRSVHKFEMFNDPDRGSSIPGRPPESRPV